jgi:hypothetical protein
MIQGPQQGTCQWILGNDKEKYDTGNSGNHILCVRDNHPFVEVPLPERPMFDQDEAREMLESLRKKYVESPIPEELLNADIQESVWDKWLNYTHTLTIYVLHWLELLQLRTAGLKLPQRISPRTASMVFYFSKYMRAVRTATDGSVENAIKVRKWYEQSGRRFRIHKKQPSNFHSIVISSSSYPFSR